MDRIFFVIEPDPIVTIDLVGTLKSAFPSSPVHEAHRLMDVAAGLCQSDERCYAFVNSGAALQDRDALLKNFAAKGGHVVFLGNRVDVDFPAALIEGPFTTPMILRVLPADAIDPPARLPAGHT